MPTLQTDTITNSAGNGAPNFPNGIQVAGSSPNTKWQRKVNSASVVNANDVTALQFNNLVVGKAYRVMYFGFILRGGSAGVINALVDFRSAANGLGSSYASVQFVANGVNFNQNDYIPLTREFIFIPTATSLYVRFTSTNAQSTFIDATLTLEELTLHTQTTDW